GDIIVARMNIAVRDGDVGRIAGVDTVGVASAAAGRPYLHAPHRESIAAAIGNVEVRRILERDAIEREVVAMREYQNARNILAPSRSRLFGQIPPGNICAKDFRTSTPVDDAVAHDTGIGHSIPADQRLAAASLLVHGAASTGPEVVEPR